MSPVYACVRANAWQSLRCHLTNYHLQFNCRFSGVSGLAISVPIQFSFSACSGRELLGISGAGFHWLDVLPATNQQYRSREGNIEHWPSTGMVSSFLHPLQDFRWKRRCCLYVGCLTPGSCLHTIKLCCTNVDEDMTETDAFNSGISCWIVSTL